MVNIQLRKIGIIKELKLVSISEYIYEYYYIILRRTYTSAHIDLMNVFRTFICHITLLPILDELLKFSCDKGYELHMPR